MKSWEFNNLQKAHLQKLQNVKPTLRTSLKCSGIPRPASAKHRQTMSKLLSDFSLSQYEKKLIELKIDNVFDLMKYSASEFEELMLRINALPGHTSRFKKLLELPNSGVFQEPKQVISRTTSNISTAATYNRRKNGSSTSNHSGLSGTDVQTLEKQKLKKELDLAKQKIEELELEIFRRQNQPIQLQKKLPLEMSRDSFFETPLAFEECKNPRLTDTSLGKSIDSYKMRSTLMNLDLEEICRCLSRAVLYHIENSPVLGSRLLGMRHKMAELFNEPGSTPDEECIYNFVKNLVVRGQMEHEIPILSLVYLERMVARSGIRLGEANWKKLIFIAFVEASKVWDDESFENNSFALAFSKYTIQEINRIEAAFLTLIDYQLTVPSSEYAKAYFMLRTYAVNKDKSFPLKALDVDTVLKLQKNANKIQEEVTAQIETLSKSI